jgi:hypothetical protein
LFRIKKTEIVDVVVVIYGLKGVGGGERILESKGESSWFQARDLSGWGFATMSKTSVFQVVGFFFLFFGIRGYTRNNYYVLYKYKDRIMPPSYSTRQRDGLMLPRRDTFLNIYKILSRPRQKRPLSKSSIALSGPKIKPSSQAWLQKALVSDVMKQKPRSTSFMVVKTILQRFRLWLGGCSLSLSLETLWRFHS